MNTWRAKGQEGSSSDSVTTVWHRSGGPASSIAGFNLNAATASQSVHTHDGVDCQKRPLQCHLASADSMSPVLYLFCRSLRSHSTTGLWLTLQETSKEFIKVKARCHRIWRFGTFSHSLYGFFPAVPCHNQRQIFLFGYVAPVSSSKDPKVESSQQQRFTRRSRHVAQLIRPCIRH